MAAASSSILDNDPTPDGDNDADDLTTTTAAVSTPPPASPSIASPTSTISTSAIPTPPPTPTTTIITPPTTTIPPPTTPSTTITTSSTTTTPLITTTLPTTTDPSYTVVSTTSTSTISLPSTVLPPKSTSIATTFSSSVIKPTPTPIIFPTTPYTGQSLLTGTCIIPQYTLVQQPDGSLLELPIIGCEDNRPNCCPSLNPITPSQSTSTVTVVQFVTDQTEVASALSVDPLTICPADYSEIGSVCCPNGFTIYSQALFGQTPCYTVLSTDLSVPAGVSAQISQLKSEIAATAASSTPTVSVNVLENEVFALSLPHTPHGSGLTTSAQIGIGVGSTVAGLSLLFLLLLLLLRRHQKRKGNEPTNISSIQSLREVTSSSQPTPGHISPLQNSTPGHISPLQNPTPGSGSGSGDPRMLPYEVPWPYQPGSNYSATFPIRTTQPMVQPASTMPYGSVPPEFVQPQPTALYQQGLTLNPFGQQGVEELESEQTTRYEADTAHLRPGGFSVLPGGRIYPHPQEMGRNTPSG